MISDYFANLTPLRLYTEKDIEVEQLEESKMKVAGSSKDADAKSMKQYVPHSKYAPSRWNINFSLQNVGDRKVDDSTSDLINSAMDAITAIQRAEKERIGNISLFTSSLAQEVSFTQCIYAGVVFLSLFKFVLKPFVGGSKRK